MASGPFDFQDDSSNHVAGGSVRINIDERWKPFRGDWSPPFIFCKFLDFFGFRVIESTRL